MLAEAAETSSKPYYLMSSRPGVMNSQQVKALREAGLVQIGGTRQGLGAHRPRRPLHDGADAAAQSDAPRRAPGSPTCSPPGRAAARSTNTTPSGCWPPTACRSRASIGSRRSPRRRRAARELGYPVVLKARVGRHRRTRPSSASSPSASKDEDELARAFAQLSERIDRLDPRPADAAFLVQEFVARRRRGVRRHLARSRFRPVAGVRHGRHRDRGHARLRAAHAAAARGRRRGDDRRDARRRHARAQCAAGRPPTSRASPPASTRWRISPGRTATCSRRSISIRSRRCRKGTAASSSMR